LLVDFEHQYVDVEATVCMEKGLLEVVACTPDTKEHESLVTVKAAPMHIHTGLVMLGAECGNPFMRKEIEDADGRRMVEVPAKGDLVKVSLVYEDAEGKAVERSVSDFIRHARKENADGEVDARAEPGKEADPKAEERLTDSFVFAGSIIYEPDSGKPQYLADESGDVITISTFGDDMLCLPFELSSANEALEWEVDPTHLPKVGTKLTLRLRPVKAGKEDQGQKQEAPAP